MDNEVDMDKAFALMIAALCVRNTFLEELHEGTVPASKTGDYSDVKVVTPYGEIPWNEVSRFNNDEMKALMKDIVNKTYTFLCNNNDPAFLDNFMNRSMHFFREWDEPEIDKVIDKMKNPPKYDLSKTSNNST